jgi:hypothetical protein
MFISVSFSATSLLPTEIFLILSGASPAGPGWRVRTKVDVSVLAVRYRAFVLAAPQHFGTGNRAPECRGAVSVGAISPAHGDFSKKFFPLL